MKKGGATGPALALFVSVAVADQLPPPTQVSAVFGVQTSRPV